MASILVECGFWLIIWSSWFNYGILNKSDHYSSFLRKFYIKRKNKNNRWKISWFLPLSLDFVKCYDRIWSIFVHHHGLWAVYTFEIFFILSYLEYILAKFKMQRDFMRLKYLLCFIFFFILILKVLILVLFILLSLFNNFWFLFWLDFNLILPFNLLELSLNFLFQEKCLGFVWKILMIQSIFSWNS